MKYYEYEINYNSKNGEMGAVAVKSKMTEEKLLRHLQKTSKVESFKPRDFEATEITQTEYKEMWQ